MKQSLSPFFQVWRVGYELQALELAMAGQWSVVTIEGSVGGALPLRSSQRTHPDSPAYAAKALALHAVVVAAVPPVLVVQAVGEEVAEPVVVPSEGMRDTVARVLEAGEGARS